MFLGRITAASRFSAMPMRSAFVPATASWATRAAATNMVAVRNAATVTSPRPLSVRMDSLMVKCVVAALIYFVPQDAIFLGGVLMAWHSKASSISPCTKAADVEAAVEEFKAKKGLESVNVYKGRTWHVSIK
eukprot:CAMPEP_0117544442 /NCGR_PEP_ID=MMETSP0784-20121206/45573_1 /TAXON_ID=39447 /ORGANISM="" /LENGTH=131 /DNA_ID=CAMNT_0005341241 /DNA_START=62 /DNA_END=457 /DNA_ORIENTATION=-